MYSSAVSASRTLTSRPANAGFVEIRTNAASVRPQVPHVPPLSMTPASHRCAASFITWVAWVRARSTLTSARRCLVIDHVDRVVVAVPVDQLEVDHVPGYRAENRDPVAAGPQRKRDPRVAGGVLQRGEVDQLDQPLDDDVVRLGGVEPAELGGRLGQDRGEDRVVVAEEPPGDDLGAAEAAERDRQ